MNPTVPRQPHSDKASVLAVMAVDPVSFVCALMTFCTVAIVLGVGVHAQVTGIQPKESWTEIAVGVALIATALFAVIGYRVRSINHVLAVGTRHTAQIDRFLAVNLWVIVQLHYERHGVQKTHSMWLANSRRSRRLGRASEVTVATDTVSSNQLVIADLYI